MTMITPSYLGETIEYSSLHACRSTLEDPTANTVPSRPRDSVNDGSLPVIVQAAMRQDMELSNPGDRSQIIARVASLKTRADAAAYFAEVVAKRRSSTQHPLN